MGHVGRFTSVDAVIYPRARRVICRTSRGLEVGQVLGPAPQPDNTRADGSVLRAVTPEDELLMTRMDRNKRAAFQACTELLKRRQSDAVLMDVEQLFDGQSIYFYFLGEPDPQLELITQQLADAYDTKVQFRKFAETVTHGCGPGCGTEDAPGGGCDEGGCSGCPAASGCRTRTA